MDQSEVQVGSMRGFHTGDRCLQATVKVHGLSLLPDVDGLHGPPVPVSSGSGLDLRSLPVNRMLGLLCMHCYSVLGISCLHCILVFRHSLLHGASCFSDVCELAFTAGHFIDNIPFLLHWGLMLHLHYYAPQCLRGSDGGLHP